MFYNNKILFFIVLLLMSAVLRYFLVQNIYIVPITNNIFLSFVLLFVSIIIFSFILALIGFIIFSIINKVIMFLLKQKREGNTFFIFWLFFTVFAYMTVFIIFYKSISY